MNATLLLWSAAMVCGTVCACVLAILLKREACTALSAALNGVAE